MVREVEEEKGVKTQEAIGKEPYKTQRFNRYFDVNG